MSLKKIVSDSHERDYTIEYTKGLISGLTVGSIIGSFFTLIIIIG